MATRGSILTSTLCFILINLVEFYAQYLYNLALTKYEFLDENSLFNCVRDRSGGMVCKCRVPISIPIHLWYFYGSLLYCFRSILNPSNGFVDSPVCTCGVEKFTIFFCSNIIFF